MRRVMRCQRTRSEEILQAYSLYLALERNLKERVKELVEQQGANPNEILPEPGLSPFHLAVGHESGSFAKEMTVFLLKHGGDPNVLSNEGVTPVHIASAQGRIGLLWLLLMNGGNPWLKDKDCRNAFNYARDENQLEALRVLEENRKEDVEEESAGRKYKMSFERLIYDGGDSGVAALSNYRDTAGLDQSSGLEDSIVDASATDTEDSFYTAPFDTSDSLVRKFRTLALKEEHRTDSNDDAKISFNHFNNLDGKRSDFKCSTMRRGMANCLISEDDCSEISSINSSCESDNDTTLSCNCSSCVVMTEEALSGTESTPSVTATEYRYTDEEEGVVLLDRRYPPPSMEKFCVQRSSRTGSGSQSDPSVGKTSTASSWETEKLRSQLYRVGYSPGPITATTKKMYARQVKKVSKGILPSPLVAESNIRPPGATCSSYSALLQQTMDNLSFLNLEHGRMQEQNMRGSFDVVDRNRRWREGNSKTSFNYLLLDPRILNNLPLRSVQMQTQDVWNTFVSAIFYVGKGTRARPYAHLYEATIARAKKSEASAKVQRILDIWESALGVVSVHVFHNIMPVEAYTREAAMIDSLGVGSVCNMKRGGYFGITSTWTMQEKQELGVYLLYKAMNIFLNEGERQLHPVDIV